MSSDTLPAIELSIVIPVFNEEKNLPEFFRRAVPVIRSVAASFELIFVMDPCRDRTEDLLKEKAEEHPEVKIIKFSRRFGQAMAILAGCQYSLGKAVIVMDVDLQDPPELIPQMWAEFQAGFDVVMLKRRTREGETWRTRGAATLPYRHFAKL